MASHPQPRGTVNDSTIQGPVVQFPDYVYYVATCLNSAQLRLYGVRIDYDPAVFRDGFEDGTTDGWSYVVQ